MQTYKEFRPTPFDSRGLGLEDRQSWLVAPVLRTRDSDCLAQSNFEVALEALGGEGDDVEVHCFNHWGPGWFEVILVRPDTEAAKEAASIEAALADYPVLDENDFSEREDEEANRVWADCYDDAERVKYIRDHRSQFDFHDFADLMGCARGHHFSGYASELLH